jgi:hypothetical protein
MSSVIERLVVQIEANAAQLQAEMAKGASASKQLGASVGQTTASAGSMGQRFASAGLQIASAAENMARAGKVGGEGLKQIITQGAQMAFMFGPQGAVVGAAGIASLAIIEIFQSTSRETRRLLDEIESRARNSVEGQLTAVRAAAAQLRKEQEDRPTLRQRAAGAFQLINPTDNRQEERRQEAIQRKLELLATEERALLVRLSDARRDAFEEEVRRLAALRDQRALTAEQLARLALREQQIEASIASLRAEAGKGSVAEQDANEKALIRQLNLLRTIRGEAAKQTKTPVVGTTDLDEANKRLDEFRKKREDNARQLREMLSTADRDLATLTGDAVRVLNAQIDEYTEKARAVGATESEIRKIVAPYVAARNAAEALNGAIAEINVDPSVQQALRDGTEAGAENARVMADEIERAVDVAAGLATVLFGAESSMTRMVTHAGQLARGFSSIAELASAAGGLGKLLSTGGGLASALPAVGAIVAGIGGIVSVLSGFSQESPEQRALREAMEHNSRRLVELRAGIDELTLTVSGSDTAAIRDTELTRFRESGRDEFTGEPTFEEVDLDIQSVLAGLRFAGVSLEELRQVAADLHITLSETPTIDQLRQLQAAIRTFSLKKMLDTLDGQLRLLELKARIDPEAFSGIDLVLAKIDILTGKTGGGKGIPAIAEALAGLDPTAPDFAAQAIERLKTLFGSMGDLDLSAFGDIDPSELPDIIAELIESLLATIPETKSAADQFREAWRQVGILTEFGLLESADQIKRATIAAFKGSFGDVPLDFSSLEAFEASAAKFIEEVLLADGVLSDEELALIDGMRDVAGSFKTAEQAAREAAAAERARAATLLDLDLELDDVTDPREILRRRLEQFMAVFGEALPLPENFAELTGGALDAAIRELVDMLVAMGEGAELAGIPVQEMIDALVGLERAGDAASQELRSLSDQLRNAFSDVDFALTLENLTDPLERLVRRAQAAAQVDPRLAAALGGADLRSEAGRAAAEAALVALGRQTTDVDLRTAITDLLDDLRSIVAPGQAQDGLGGRRPAEREGGSRSGVESLTERTGHRLVEFAESAHRQRAQIIAILQSMTGLGPIRAPAIPAALLGAGAGGISVTQHHHIHITGPISVGDPQTFARQLSRASALEMARALDDVLGERVRSFRAFRGEA